MTKQIDKNSFGYRLAKIRFELGMNKKDFSGKLKIAGASLGRYENNERSPDYQFLENLAKELNVNPDFIFGLDEVIFKQNKS